MHLLYPNIVLHGVLPGQDSFINEGQGFGFAFYLMTLETGSGSYQRPRSAFQRVC